MWKDPIVEETRELRAKYADKLGNDPERIFNDIQKRQRESGKTLVTFPPRKPVNSTNPA